MSAFDSLRFSLKEFSGTARLFPLPNLVLFPHVMQPLHVFEQRYRTLLETAMTDDRLMAMALLAPGWEGDYEGRPPLSPMACLGRIATSHRLKDGTYNVLVVGLRRVRLVRELVPVRDFREAEIEICEDYCPPGQGSFDEILRRKLCQAFRETAPVLPEGEQLDHLLRNDISLAVLTDVIGYLLDIGLKAKEALLAETDVRRRAEMLLEYLPMPAIEEADDSTQWFPPEFSVN